MSRVRPPSPACLNGLSPKGGRPWRLAVAFGAACCPGFDMPLPNRRTDAGAFGRFEMLTDGAVVCGAATSPRFRFTVGSRGMSQGGRLRIGFPNTGWQRPIVPQQRYWDELVFGHERRLAPFHPVNTTA